MNIMRSLRWILATVVTTGSLTSCSLEQLNAITATLVQRRPSGSPLQHGVRYEVRPAVAAGVPFKPTEMKRYYFVMDASGARTDGSAAPLQSARPPLMAARTSENTARTPVVARSKAKVLVAHRSTRTVPPSASAGDLRTVRTTAYCHDESDHIVYGKLTAVGTRLKYGAVRSAAADWSRYPVGTRFRISGEPDVVYEVDDYGSALVGTGTIDLYKPTRSAMNNWGVRHVDIEVIEWGSYEESMSIMSERSRWPHVRRMINDIQSRVSQVAEDSVKGPATAAL